MKIAIISSFSPKSTGGIARIAYESAEVFSKDHQVLVIGTSESGENEHIKVNENYTFFGVSNVGGGIVRVPKLGLFTALRVFKVLREFNADVVHFHDQSPMIPFLCMSYSLIHKKPTVYSAHILFSNMNKFGITNVFKKTKVFFTEKRSQDISMRFMKFVTHIHTIYTEGKLYFNLKFPQKRVFLINNPRNLEAYKEVGCSKKGLNIDLLYIGSFSPRKNQLHLLKTLTKLPEKYKLTLIGYAFDKDYYQELKKFVLEHDLESRVTFIDYVAHKDIPKYYEKAHVFISASLLEVQSLVILEALASRTPIVALENETTKDFIDENTGFLLSQDVYHEVFAEKIEEIANLSLHDYEKLSKNCRKRVENHDWEVVKHEYYKLYGQLSQEIPTKVSFFRGAFLFFYSLVFAVVVRTLYFIERLFP